MMLQVAPQYNTPPATRYHDTERMMTMMLPNPVRSNRKQNKNKNKSSPRRTHTHTRKGQSHYSHRLNQNLNQNQNQDYHQNHYEQEELEVEVELELLPDMVESPSGSIETIETFSSGGGERHEREHNYGYNSPPETGSPTAPSSPLYSSSSRMHQRFAAFALSGSQKNKNQSSQSPRRTSTKKEHHRSKSMENEPSNSSIMMGADIIRRQLSGEQNHSSPTRQASPKSRHSPRTNTTTNNNTNANNNNNKTNMNKNISPQHALNGVGRTSIDNETWDPFLTEEDAAANNAPTLKNRIIDLHRSPTKNRQHRVQEILSAGDTYFGNKAAAEAKAAELRNRKPKEQTGTGTRSSNLNCMVQRLSEVDDSTFASSSDGNGYMLPNNLLMSGLTCGGLNNTLTCANPQLQLANSSSPSATQPAATKGRINTSIMYQHDEDEFETSTLDFLANLHTKEEDLNFVFGDLENEQVHLCAQSGIPTAQTYFEQFSTRNVSNHNNNNNNNNNANHNRNEVSSSSYVTAASIPFENMLSSRSSLHQELLKDPAFRHALKAGTLWQSLCSQHVRFPATWWDGLEPVGPPLGSSKKQQQQQHGGNHNSTNTSVKPWSYLGRHRVRDDAKLGHLIGNRASSGRILLHLLVRDDVSGDVTEDIACGCYHPNARGVRTTRDFDPTVEDCRDVWIAHRRRVKDRDPRGRHNNHVSTIESLLKHQNKNRVHESPLGAQGGKHSVDNKNMRTIFGSKPPVFTIFCTESELFELFQNKLDGSIPASVVLLRRYLGYNQIS